MKNFIQTLVVTVFVLAATFTVAPTQAEAACSYPGYINSQGNCVVSYSSNTPYRYQNQYRTQYTVLDAQIQQFEAYIARLEQLVEQLKARRDTLYDGSYYYDYSDGRADVDVTTRSATDISDDEATLRGEIDWNGEDEATVYFQYGRTASLGSETTHFVLEEDDDDEAFEQTITNLRDDTKYYFRAVAEDEDGDTDYGSTYSFVTDEHGSSNDDEDYPDVDTDSATNISDDSARLRGDVDMNDFRNGIVFFVYGEDEDQIDDIADDYDTYNDVDEDGDDLQKIKVDNDLDGSAAYYANVSGGLDDDTDIYFALCVEFEDEDNDEMIICGDTEDFTTDES